MMSRLESLSARITPTLFLLLAVGGALLVATPCAAEVSPCKFNGVRCKTNQDCCSGACTGHVCGTPTTTTSATTSTTTTSTTTTTTTTTSSTTTTTTPAALCDISCAPVTCASEGALCEPCSGGPRLARIGNGFC